MSGVMASVGAAVVLTATAVSIGPAQNIGRRLPNVSIPSSGPGGNRILNGVVTLALTIEFMRELASSISMRDQHDVLGPNGCVLVFVTRAPSRGDRALFRESAESGREHGAVYVCSQTFDHFEVGDITSFSLFVGVMLGEPPLSFPSIAAMRTHRWTAGPIALL
jgi:hypothetical protein